jgi:L-histidine N-alpha-methyltransferase
MHLRANKDQRIESPYFDKPLCLSKDETIHTEYSHKFTDSDIARFGDAGGFEIEHIFSDNMEWFRDVVYVKR